MWRRCAAPGHAGELGQPEDREDAALHYQLVDHFGFERVLRRRVFQRGRRSRRAAHARDGSPRDGIHTTSAQSSAPDDRPTRLAEVWSVGISLPQRTRRTTDSRVVLARIAEERSLFAGHPAFVVTAGTSRVPYRWPRAGGKRASPRTIAFARSPPLEPATALGQRRHELAGRRTCASPRGWLVNPHRVMSRSEHAKAGLASAGPV
jgi:hypothetical protein